MAPGAGGPDARREGAGKRKRTRDGRRLAGPAAAAPRGFWFGVQGLRKGDRDAREGETEACVSAGALVCAKAE